MYSLVVSIAIFGNLSFLLMAFGCRLRLVVNPALGMVADYPREDIQPLRPIVQARGQRKPIAPMPAEPPLSL